MPEHSSFFNLDVTLSEKAVRDFAESFWSPENYFSVWTWAKGLVSYQKSHALGQFFMECELNSPVLYPYALLDLYVNTFNKGTFKALAVEVAKYLRCKAEKKAAGKEKEAKLVWDDIHQFYFDLPFKEEFDNVERRHFADDYKLVSLTEAVQSWPPHEIRTFRATLVFLKSGPCGRKLIDSFESRAKTQKPRAQEVLKQNLGMCLASMQKAQS